MADLLSVALHLPSHIGLELEGKSVPQSPRSRHLTRSSSSENDIDTVVQTFGISCGKQVVDLEFQDLSYTLPGGIGKG